MFKDGISVPALSLKIMINTALEGFNDYKKKFPPKLDHNIEVDDKIIEQKSNIINAKIKKLDEILKIII